MSDNLPATVSPDRALVKGIAMDIGKSAVSKIRLMYPDVYAAMNSGCRLTLRNHIYNEIMAALDTTDADEITRRLQDRRAHRREMHAIYEKIREHPMTPITDAELEELKAGLAGVTPGPWRSVGGLLMDDCEGNARFFVRPEKSEGWQVVQSVGPGGAANAAHIARCSPDKIAALIARLEASEGANAKLVADLKITADDAEVAGCESCNAPLFVADDFVSDPNGVSGCWSSMTDLPSKRERPCYAYRVGKADARTPSPAKAEG